MFSRLQKGIQKVKMLGVVVSAAFGRCPKHRVEAITAAIPNPETKNRGFDLRGWTYEKVTSKKSNESYYYYHLPSKTADAPLFLLVHGLFLDGRTFIRFGPLADAFELVAIELPHDSSFYKGAREDFPRLLQDFIDALGPRSIYLGGVSLGGQIAMFYMAQNPMTQVRGLALISTDMVKTDRELKKAKRAAKTIARLTRGDDGRMLCILHALAEGRKKKARGEAAEAMEIFVLKRPSFYREVMAIATDLEAVPRLEAIAAPTLIIHGDSDTTVPIESARRLADHIPNAVFKTVEGGEHTIAYTRGERISAMVRDFFAGPG